MPHLAIADPHDFDPIGLKPPAAAKLIGYSVPTMERWRAQGIGPRYVQLTPGGSVVYPKPELEKWLLKQARTKTAK
jgi:predicted DNA-binding transcriptional regulator AlpA